MDGLGECLRVWSASAEALLNAAALLRIDLEGVAMPEGRVGEWLDRLVTQLRLLRAALKDGDFVLTGDILRYELEAATRGWAAAADALIDAAGRQLAPGADSRIGVPHSGQTADVS